MTNRPRSYQTIFADLKRRNVFQVAAVYGAVAFVVMQAADFFVPALRLPESVAPAIALIAILGFPLALGLAWAFEVTPEACGARRWPSPASWRRSWNPTSAAWRWSAVDPRKPA